MRTIFVLLALLWPAHTAAQTETTPKIQLEQGEFDPSLWDRTLQSFVSEAGVDWEKWKSSDAGEVKEFLAAASDFKLKRVMGKEPKIAFLLNVYSAFAVQQILEKYPVNSVADIDGFFDTNTVSMDGEDRTLNDLAGMIRAIGKHMPTCALSISNGAKGYAGLPGEAFTATNLKTQSTAVGKAFLEEQIVLDGPNKTITLPGVIKANLPYFESQDKGLAGSIYTMVHAPVLVVLGSPKEIRYHEIDLTLRSLTKLEK